MHFIIPINHCKRLPFMVLDFAVHNPRLFLIYNVWSIGLLCVGN